MRKTYLTLAAAATLTIAGSAFADSIDPNMSAQPASLRDDSKRIICHYVTHDGSLIRQKRCATQEGWDRTRRETEQTISALQIHSYSVPFGK